VCVCVCFVCAGVRVCVYVCVHAHSDISYIESRPRALGDILKIAQVSSDDLERLIAFFDADASGSIDLLEFKVNLQGVGCRNIHVPVVPVNVEIPIFYRPP
jgi:hypothetical protein